MVTTPDGRELGRRRETRAAPSIQTVAQHFLYFFPDPQGHGSLRPTLCDTAGCLTAMRSPTLFIVW